MKVMRYCDGYHGYGGPIAFLVFLVNAAIQIGIVAAGTAVALCLTRTARPRVKTSDRDPRPGTVRPAANRRDRQSPGHRATADATRRQQRNTRDSRNYRRRTVRGRTAGRRIYSHARSMGRQPPDHCRVTRSAVRSLRSRTVNSSCLRASAPRSGSAAGSRGT